MANYWACIASRETMTLESNGLQTAASLDGGSHPTFLGPPSSRATLHGSLSNKVFKCGVKTIGTILLVVYIVSIMCEAMASTTTKLDNLLSFDGCGIDESLCMRMLHPSG